MSKGKKSGFAEDMDYVEFNLLNENCVATTNAPADDLIQQSIVIGKIATIQKLQTNYDTVLKYVVRETIVTLINFAKKRRNLRYSKVRA